MNRTLLRAWTAAALVTALGGSVAQTLPAKPEGVAQASARPSEQGPAWSALTSAQQAALAPLRQDWPNIDAGRKKKWLEVVQRFSSLSPAERERVQERMADWARMTPAERGRARLQFQESRQIPTQERQALWEAYQALPSDERRALAEKAVAPAPSPASSPRREARLGAGPVAKQNVVPAPAPGATTRPVTPMVVQAKPGASTTLVTRPTVPPAHHQAGLPKIAATPAFVDPVTLLPTRGPQAAAVVTPAAATPTTAPAAPEQEPEAPAQPASPPSS